MKGDSDSDTRLLQEMANEARTFLEGFDWCTTIKEMYFDLGLGGIVAILLTRIVPTVSSDVIDEWLWVIVGDLPPAYLVVDLSPDPVAALKTYILEMKTWVSAVQGGEPVDNLIPVNITPSPESALLLDRRLAF